MPSLNFQKQFVPLIESGQKRQTIRPVGKRPIKAGDKLFLFSGLRTKNTVNLKPKNVKSLYRDWYSVNMNWYVKCKSVEPIKIFGDEHGGFFELNNRIFLDDSDGDKFAKADGFKNAEEAINFFKKQYGLPFEGVLIKW